MMKVLSLSLFPLLSITTILASPVSDQTVLNSIHSNGYSDLTGNLFGGIAKEVSQLVHDAAQHMFEGSMKEKAEKFVHEGKQLVKQNGLVCKCKLPWTFTVCI